MPIHTRKVVRNHIKPFTGAAAFALQMRERGWRIVQLDKQTDVVRVTYEREERESLHPSVPAVPNGRHSVQPDSY